MIKFIVEHKKNKICYNSKIRNEVRMQANNRIVELMEARKEKLYTEAEIQKFNVITEFIENKDCFFQAKAEAVIGMLEFLGVPEEEVLDLYIELTSPENYQKNVPQKGFITK